MNAKGFQSGMKVERKCLVVLSAVFLFCNYYYLYFYGFDQGVSLSPGYFSVLKLVGVMFFTLAFFEFRGGREFSSSEVLLFVFFVFSFAFFAVKRLFVDLGSDLYLNFVICVLPFIVLSLRRDFSNFFYFFEVSAWILIFQVAVDSVVKYKGLSLWDNKAFVGGFGNPSSFGLFCNVVLAYVLFVRRASLSSVVMVLFSVFAIFSSKSLFSLFAMFFLVFYYFWTKSKLVSMLVLVFLGIGLVFLGDWLFSGHLAYKLSSLYDLVFEGGAGGSQSVMLRMEIHKMFFERILESFLPVFLFGYLDYYYYYADSQFLSFFGSFGVLMSLAFFSAVLVLLISIKKRDSVSRFFWVSIFLLFLMFFSNRVIDYYPIPVLFFMLLFGAKRVTAYA